ncbi:MAG: hypothetical protein H6536_06295 [Bacteroidales bacterium]|nr:hypothetical protein [Bacteroidales bacterium]
MVYLYIALFLLLGGNSPRNNTNDYPAINKAVDKLVVDLVSRYPKKNQPYLAVLQFRTSNNNLPKFNQLIVNQINASKVVRSSFNLIEPSSVNHLIDEMGWNLSMSSSYSAYSKINESIFRATGLIADAYLYGTIRVDEEMVTITAYIVPNGIASSAISSSVQIPIRDVPENWLPN